MMAIYCRGNHHTEADLCGSCQGLLAYAEKRLDACPHEKKPACRDCDVHCYAPDQREAIQAVMRYAGPHMALRRPLVALGHLFSRRQKDK